MTWQAELRAWLANGPRPHEPPGGAPSVYTWLKDTGERILAAVAPVPSDLELARLLRRGAQTIDDVHEEYCTSGTCSCGADRDALHAHADRLDPAGA